MKICPNCQQKYPDDDLNFCLNDGGILTKVIEDAPPTILLNKPRTTNQNWSYQEPWNDPFAPWWQDAQPPAPYQDPNMMRQPWSQGVDQTLPIISLVLGILSVVFTCWCGGFYFGIAALITGYICMNNANNNPQTYGGKGMAIAGLILGGLTFVGALVLILFAILGNIS